MKGWFSGFRDSHTGQFDPLPHRINHILPARNLSKNSVLAIQPVRKLGDSFPKGSRASSSRELSK